MHILYNIAGFYRPAGMERVLADKANWLVANGYRVSILTTEQKGRPYAFPLDERIEVRDLGIGYEDNNGAGLWDKLVHYPGKQLRHRKALEKVLKELKPDITVSMFCNEVNLLPRIHDGSAKVLEVHFSRLKRLQYGRSGLWALVDRLRSRQDASLVKKYARFVVLTQDDRRNWGAGENIRVIGNPVNFHPDRPAPLDSRVVLAVGRLTYQKGLDRLLDAWKIAVAAAPGWKLMLAGDGELRGELIKQAESLGVSDSVRFAGNVSDIAACYSNASIVALSSHYEGLPMVLLEAQAFGVPAVSFDCQCGPREIIRDGVDGLLVKEGNVPALASALRRIMLDDALRLRMGAAAYEGARRWAPDTIMQQWTSLFEEIS
ncbi:MAG: glycosyltransferase family 4 protein [Bacteroidales bacterium]|nr:glycosyltransferase family 4 protein [Bacteroidales bacterium]